MNQNGMNRLFSQSWYVFTGFCDRHFSRILFTCGFNLFVIENKLIELIFLSLQFPPLCRRMKVQLKDR